MMCRPKLARSGPDLRSQTGANAHRSSAAFGRQRPLFGDERSGVFDPSAGGRPYTLSLYVRDAVGFLGVSLAFGLTVLSGAYASRHSAIPQSPHGSPNARTNRRSTCGSTGFCR